MTVVTTITISTNKVLHCIFSHVIVQPYKCRCRMTVVLEVGITEMLYNKSSRNCIINEALRLGLGMFVYLDKASSHTPELVKQFLKSKNVTILLYPPYSPDEAPCEFFFLFFSKIWKDSYLVVTRSLKVWLSQSYLRGLPKSGYPCAFQNWINELKLCILDRNEYFKILACFHSTISFF